jgi:hypothetical protein
MKDLTGRTFGRLTVLAFAGKVKGCGTLWWCRCSCERGTEMFVTDAALISKNTRSCGCLQRESVTKTSRNNGTHGRSKTNRKHKP